MKAAIMGFGTVGSGVYEVLDRNRETVRKKAGEPIEIKYILNRRDLPGSPVEELVVHEIGTILEDPETGLVVETMGGTSPAYEYVKCCLQAGKHVVTSNKNLVAAHGTELLAIAREKRVSFLFEASVGGGIPIIRTINESLAGDVVEEISGILNGTTNYILTKMYEEGWGFDEALKMAKAGICRAESGGGYRGYDTCRKIAIDSGGLRPEVDYEQIPTEGITKLTDVDFVSRQAGVLPLLAVWYQHMQGRQVLPGGGTGIHQCQKSLYSVSGVFNGILLNSNMLGESMYYGSGAGKLPTASAVVGDMIAAVQLKDRPAALGWTGQRLEVLPVRQLPWKYFARFEGSREEKKTLTEELFGKVRWLELAGLDEFAILTGPMTGEEFDRAAGQLGGLRRAIRAQV
ncbi:MAG: homoserine dehydrogenase [Enterocloster sp.]